MIKLKIDVTKINKDRIFVGKKGKYIDLVLVEKPNDFGDDGFIAHDLKKEEREAGATGGIIGNWKHVGGAKPTRQSAPSKADPQDDDDDCPF